MFRLICDALRTLKHLFFDDAVMPLNGQIPVTMSASRNTGVA